MLLLLGAGLLLFLVNPIAALVAVAVFWLVLPLWIMPMVRRRLLPTWDMVKDELEVQGYTEANFLSGDWWKKK
jgi:membrane protein YdbS with pleckstrin-like domain